MKHLIVLGLLCGPIALSACKQAETRQEVAETSTVTFVLTGMT